MRRRLRKLPGRRRGGHGSLIPVHHCGAMSSGSFLRYGKWVLVIGWGLFGLLWAELPRAEAEPMDVTKALRIMRQAKSSADAGDHDNACKLYDKVVKRFPTWWMSLVGRVRCGLERDDPEEDLATMLAKAEHYEGPADIIIQLRTRLLRKSGKIHELCAMLLPAAIRGQSVSLPLNELLVYAWLRGRLGDSVRLVLRMRAEGSVDVGALRLGAEAALLTKDAPAADALLPDFLTLHPDRVLMVRYIRDLRRRGEDKTAELWTQKWEEIVRSTLPARYSGR